MKRNIYIDIYIQDSFSCQHEKLSSTVRTATQVVHTHRTSCRSGWPVAFLAPTYILPRPYGPNTVPVHAAKKIGRSLSDAWRSTFKIGPAQLRSVTRIVPKSPFLCVNRNSTRYNVRVDARAIRHSVNKALLFMNKFSHSSVVKHGSTAEISKQV